MSASIKLIDLKNNNSVEGSTSAEIEINTLKQDTFLLDIEYIKGDETECNINIFQAIDINNKQIKIFSKETGKLQNVLLKFTENESSIVSIPVLNTIDKFILKANLNGASSDKGGTLVVKIKPNLFKNFI